MSTMQPAHTRSNPPLYNLPPCLPCSYSGPSLLPSVEHQLAKRALLQQVLERRLYRPADLHALFEAAVMAAEAPEHKYVVRQAVQELRQELRLE